MRPGESAPCVEGEHRTRRWMLTKAKEPPQKKEPVKASDCHTVFTLTLLCSECSDQPPCGDQQEPTGPGYCGIFLEISRRSWSVLVVLVIPRAPWRQSP